MYKDKDKQREANAERQRRYKAKHKGVTSEGVTDKALPDDSDGMKRWRAAMNKPKRGKDIKTFADLSPDVQQTIKKMSSDDGGVTWDKAEKDRRTAIAINYQHQFPDRYHSVGVA